jgi:hypothetical protein
MHSARPGCEHPGSPERLSTLSLLRSARVSPEVTPIPSSPTPESVFDAADRILGLTFSLVELALGLELAVAQHLPDTLLQGAFGLLG